MDYYNTRAGRRAGPFPSHIMATVAIIGAGDLGAATAQALASRDCAFDVLLVDASAGVAAGKALDIQQAGAVTGFHTRLSGAGDVDGAGGCRVCVVADRSGPVPQEWAGDEGLSMLARAASAIGDAPMVFAGATQAELLSRVAREAHVPRERLIGSAPEALASSVKAIVAMEARCSPAEIALTVLGTPPGFLVPWSEASIGGYALERVLSPVQLARIEGRVARLWPPGAYPLGVAAARVAEAVLTLSRRSFSVLVQLDGEFGVRHRAGALPAVLSATGIVHTRVPLLGVRERVLLETALGA
jgi:malate dehydrogenase